ncbi:MAG: hypothetical protein J6T74_08265, partial [Clostridia bacterium]|nr:hypothetical protein [Clostridia bacterium]
MNFKLELKKKIGEKYSFLKLFKVVYNTTFCNCLITFIYPENAQTLTQEEKNIITKAVEEIIKINGKLEIKFLKSYLDKKLIVSKIKDYLNENFISISQFLNEENFDYFKENLNVNIIIKCNSTIYEYIENNNIIQLIKEYLNNSFCGNFSLSTKIFGNDFTGENLGKRAIEQIAKLPKLKRTKRYNVTEVNKVFGSDIMPSPELISDQEKEKQS